MDGWPRRDEPATPEPAAPAPAEEPLADAVSRLTARIDELEKAVILPLEGLADTIETRVVDHVSAELASVTVELRRAVAELGRMLVRDRGRIAQVLTEHRDALLAELRGSAEAPPPPPPEAAPEPGGD
jgi:hypothetical protein